MLHTYTSMSFILCPNEPLSFEFPFQKSTGFPFTLDFTKLDQIHYVFIYKKDTYSFGAFVFEAR